jgi:hypothetical protein
MLTDIFTYSRERRFIYIESFFVKKEKENIVQKKKTQQSTVLPFSHAPQRRIF